jgi:hypothetical protein
LRVCFVRSERRIHLRAIGALIGCILLIVAVIFWWPAIEPSMPELASAAHADPDSHERERADASPTPLEAPSPRLASDSLAEPVTGFELQKVYAYLFEAKLALRELESKHAKSVMVQDTPGLRIEHVHLPALTREQLDPVYTLLSNDGRKFPADSTGAKVFRQKADEFLQTLTKLPARYARRNLHKNTGQVSYSLCRLSEDATVVADSDGSVSIRTSGASSSDHVSSVEVSHLFREEPE